MRFAQLAAHGKDYPPELMLNYFLPRKQFLRRLWYAILYVFNRFPRWGYFGETVFDVDGAVNLFAFLAQYIKAYETWKAKDRRG